MNYQHQFPTSLVCLRQGARWVTDVQRLIPRTRRLASGWRFHLAASRLEDLRVVSEDPAARASRQPCCLYSAAG